MTAGLARILTAGSDLDLRALPEIARDRSAAGRARLFAFLASLLMTRWERLSTGERTQLAELIAVLWSRGTIVDRARLATHFTGQSDLPPALRVLLDTAVPAKQEPAAKVILPAAAAPLRKTTITISVTQQPVVMRRHLPLAPSVSPVHPASGDDRALLSPSSALSREQGIETVPAMAESALQEGDGALSRVSLSPPDLLTAPSVQSPSRQVVDELPDILAPRDNPHRLTTDLLAEALASGDLARFEVMLASLTGLRAPLLRRMLRESGDEALAILARAIGMDQVTFMTQWQNWQHGQVELGRASFADRAGRKRIGAFFAALTEGQIDRLLRRWRNSVDRLFASS